VTDKCNNKLKIRKMTIVVLCILMAAAILSGCGNIAELASSISLSGNNSNNRILNSAAIAAVNDASSNSTDNSGIMAEDKKQMENIDLNSKMYSDYYISKVTSFMNSYSGHGKIVFLGDSLTDMCNWSEMLNNTDILNRGISNDTTAGLFNRLSEVTRLKPQKVFIMIGINDIGKGLSTDEIIINYNGIINSIKKDSPETTIYVESVLPINRDIFKTSTNEKQITDLNWALSKLCGDSGAQFINLYPLFTVSQDKLNPDYTQGGLHINGKGYLVWSEAVKEYCK
jgi:lysophospholipase L1-like esterase